MNHAEIQRTRRVLRTIAATFEMDNAKMSRHILGAKKNVEKINRIDLAKELNDTPIPGIGSLLGPKPNARQHGGTHQTIAAVNA